MLDFTKQITFEALALLKKSYIDVLPFIFLYVVGEIFINLFLDFNHNFEGFSSFLLIFLAIHSIFYFFCLLLVLNTYCRIYNNIEINYYDIFIKSIKRFFPVLIFFISVCLLFFIVAFVAFFIMAMVLWSSPGDPFGAAIFAAFIGLVIFVILLFIFWPYLLVEIYLIAIKLNPLRSALDKSPKLLHNYKVKIAGVLFVFVALKLALSAGLSFILPIRLGSSELTNFLFLPFLACLILTLSIYLEKHNSSSN